MEIKQKIYFPGQQADEKICYIFRQHWIEIAAKLLIWVFFLIVFLVIDYLDVTYFPTIMDKMFLDFIEVFKVMYMMFLALGFFMVFVLYYLNIHIITNKRIVDINQPSLLNHTISELHLRQIQDVTAEVQGVLENVFNFGDVYIQTAGETERFVFNKIPNPTKVTKIILDLYEQIPEHVEMKNQAHIHSQPTAPTTTNQNLPS